MYKNQLQELAQRSCFNLPAYSCIREGPDHAPRFKATVNFNGERFESPTFCSTLRQAEHAAAEVALNTLAKRGPSRALAARVLDETGVYKNLLQETAHRAGLNLPVYTTVRSGPGHVPVFSCAVEIAGMKFTGDPARTKKQAQKNAAMAAWSALRKLSQHRLSSATSCSFPSDSKANEEQEQVTIARVLASLQPPESKYLSESDNQHKRHESTMSSVRTSLPMPPMCQSCGFSGFSPDMAMYQIWQQEQILQPQNHLLALAIPSTIPSAPQIYPFVQSMLQPDPCLYFPARDLASVSVGANFSIAPTNTSFYLPNQILPHLSRARSTVTIREIQEEKAENTSEFSLPAIPDSLVCNSRNETRIPKPSEDDRQKTGGSESKTNVLLGADQTVKSEWTSHGNIGSAYKQVNFQSQNPPSINNSRPIFRAQEKANAHRSFRPPPAASSSSMIRTTGRSSSSGSRMQHWQVPLAVPPIMRAGGPRNSAMPRSERFDMAGAPPLFMAPAVRIRSVVPVCSAPPRRSTQEEGSVNKEKKEPKTEEVSRTCSELGNLRI